MSSIKPVTGVCARFLLCACLCLFLITARAAQDPLPAWNDGSSKRAIIDFVQRVTTSGGPDFVPTAERIAVFDNDGTLWTQQPAYFQLLFAIDRIKALAPKHPEWKTQQPLQVVLDKALDETGQKGWTVVDMKKDWKTVYPFMRQ